MTTRRNHIFADQIARALAPDSIPRPCPTPRLFSTGVAAAVGTDPSAAHPGTSAHRPASPALMTAVEPPSDSPPVIPRPRPTPRPVAWTSTPITTPAPRLGQSPAIQALPVPGSAGAVAAAPSSNGKLLLSGLGLTTILLLLLALPEGRAPIPLGGEVMKALASALIGGGDMGAWTALTAGGD